VLYQLSYLAAGSKCSRPAPLPTAFRAGGRERGVRAG
jgi:hypothetical protein